MLEKTKNLEANTFIWTCIIKKSIIIFVEHYKEKCEEFMICKGTTALWFLA